ncbi:MAG: hypothetical protein Q9220_004006 [cf. Caloplaca sp. 1 TL-2023]
MTRPKVKVARRPLLPSILTFLYPFLQPGLFAWVADKRGPNIPYPPVSLPAVKTKSSTSPTKEVENIFINALVTASSCCQQSWGSPARKSGPHSLFTYHRARRRNVQSCTSQVRNVGGIRQYSHAPLAYSKAEYLQILDYYHDSDQSPSSFTGHEPPLLARAPPGEILEKEVPGRTDIPLTKPDEGDGSKDDVLARNLDSGNTIDCSPHPNAHSKLGSPEEESSYVAGPESSQLDLPIYKDTQGDENQKAVITRLELALEDIHSSHQRIYEAYSQIPSPGVKHLSKYTRNLLFHRLSVIETRTKQSMLRYLSLVDDMEEASLPLKQAEWNSAIAYAGRCFMHVTALEVEAALLIWKGMEHQAGVQSGPVTFNILFDIATKAGKYVLAEMILKEMDARGLDFNRFSHIGFIYFHGLKGNGAGVRKAYRDFVEAGHVVDTSVLNCVIASLIRAGEMPAAEQVYERMKKIFYEKSDQPTPTSDWRTSRDMGRILDKATKSMRDDPQALQRLQAEQHLGPNLRTFTIFLDYHVHVTGELRCVSILLDEMQKLKIPMHGRIFIKIFKGFAHNGGVKYTSWTTQRLEIVWASLIGALDKGTHGVEIMKWAVIWIVRAFARCCGRGRALEVWEEVRSRWKVADEQEKEAVEHHLRDVFEESGGNNKR